MNALIQSIYDNPEDWSVDKHRFRHKDGAAIWVANGLFGFQVETGGEFGVRQQIRAYRAYRWWLENAPLGKLSRGTPT